jgi:uncharacterized protein YbjQ (UPF0145 family)
MIVTTSPAVEGRPVRQYLGVVSAQAIMGLNMRATTCSWSPRAGRP